MAHEHHHDQAAFTGPEEVARVVADGEIALDVVAEVVGLVDAASVRRVLDIGSGPGVATCELARLLPDAEVIALDASPSMVDAVGERADQVGVRDRVSARVAELPGGVDGIADVDLVWASMSMHHVSDERAALRALASTLSPTGVVAILEFGDQRRGVPTGDEALSDRIEAAYERAFADLQTEWHGDTPSGELADMVGEAGLEIIDDHITSLSFDPPLDEAQHRYATAQLMRAAKQLEDYLNPDDLARLDHLAHDPHRADGPIIVSRRIVLARPRDS